MVNVKNFIWKNKITLWDLNTHWLISNQNTGETEKVIVKVSVLPNYNLWFYIGELKELNDIPSICLKEYLNGSQFIKIENIKNVIVGVREFILSSDNTLNVQQELVDFWATDKSLPTEPTILFSQTEQNNSQQQEQNNSQQEEQNNDKRRENYIDLDEILFLNDVCENIEQTLKELVFNSVLTRLTSIEQDLSKFKEIEKVIKIAQLFHNQYT